MEDVLKRKFHNPTPGWVGATILDEDKKRRGVSIEPGGDVWLSEVEERLTAEAPRLAEDNPFTKPWEEIVPANEETGSPRHTVQHEGVLVLSDEPPRKILSNRFTPSGADAAGPTTAGAADGEDADESGEPAAEPEVPEHTGAPPIPEQPPVEGKPGRDEIVATPGAVAANDEHLAREARRSELEALEPDALGSLIADLPEGHEDASLAREVLEARKERPSSVLENGVQGTEQIGTPRAKALV